MYLLVNVSQVCQNISNIFTFGKKSIQNYLQFVCLYENIHFFSNLCDVMNAVPFFNGSTLKTLYKAYVHSILEFVTIVWNLQCHSSSQNIKSSKEIQLQQIYELPIRLLL